MVYFRYAENKNSQNSHNNGRLESRFSAYRKTSVIYLIGVFFVLWVFSPASPIIKKSPDRREILQRGRTEAIILGKPFCPDLENKVNRTIVQRAKRVVSFGVYSPNNYFQANRLSKGLLGKESLTQVCPDKKKTREFFKN